MIPQEFKAWFEGFTEAISGSPTKEQWKRIKARVGEIDGVAVTYPLFIDRHVHHYPHYPWSFGTILTGGTTLPLAATPTISGISGCNPPPVSGDTVTMNLNSVGSAGVLNCPTVFNSSAAMCDLGKADYQALAG